MVVHQWKNGNQKTLAANPSQLYLKSSMSEEHKKNPSPPQDHEVNGEPVQVN